MVIRLKVPIEMHYTVIPMGTSKVNSSRITFVAVTWKSSGPDLGIFGPLYITAR